MTKEEILEKIKSSSKPSTARNSMGCLESWYDPFFALSQAFTEEELAKMSEGELNNLIKLGKTISEGLY